MARVQLSSSKRLCDRLTLWVHGQMKSKRMNQSELAEHLGISQQAVSMKLAGKVNITFEEFIRIIEFLEPKDDDLLWLLGK